MFENKNYEINLRIIRKQKGLSQEKLCRELSKIGFCITRSTYSKYETGSRNIPIDALICFAKFFETSTDSILGLNENSDEKRTAEAVLKL